MAGGIKLQWKDRNFSEEQHRIYKSNTPMTLGMLPTPIATLGSNITELRCTCGKSDYCS